MEVKWFLFRIKKYYAENGFLQTLFQFAVRMVAVFQWPYAVVFFKDIQDSGIACPFDNFSDRFSICSRCSEKEITDDEKQVLYKYSCKEIVDYELKERFAKHSTVWLLKINNILIGMIWSIEADTIKPYFWFLHPGEIHLYNNEIFSHYRGRGYNSILLQYVLFALKQQGHQRAYIETLETNRPELRSLQKNGFHVLALVRRLRLGSKNIIIYKKLSEKVISRIMS